ncbi:hypothetical protein WHR41_05443 [Cladosporium halotolerans]|uniref:ACB domain-containing protein n=1 Tax=Cladosporium halotolerans TaxID=1052096 RepID=A0AB34KQX9_9PEZI
MPAAQSAEFKKAVEDSRSLTKKPSNDELLEIYALFKQGTQEVKYEDAPKPGMFDMAGKAKYNEWAKVKDMKPEEAQKKYVEAVKKLVAKYK